MSISNNQTTFLYKKNLGVVDTSSTLSYNTESAGNARPNILSSQIYSQPIPLNVPTDFNNIQYVNANGSLDNLNDLEIGTVSTSSSYPYIQNVLNLKSQ